MNILVAVASKHGSTHEIAQAIAEEMNMTGEARLSAEVRVIDEALDISGYDAVIIGSAVYIGNWLPEARRFVERNRETLVRVPVWLFSSGPLGHDDPKPKEDPAHLDAMMQATGARGHRILVGKLDRSALGLGERLTVKMVKAPYGDFRDWDVIRAWAREIGAALLAEASAGV